MTGQLDGLIVVVDARDRRIMLAASWLAELGASVHVVGDLLPSGRAPAIDRAWTGAGGLVGGKGVSGAPARNVEVDLVVVAHGRAASEIHRGPARCVVTLHGTPPDGPLGGRDLDERELAARAGLAVAIGLPDRDPLPMPEGVLDTMVAMHIVSAGLAGLLQGAHEAEVVATDAIAHAVIMNSNLFVPFGRPW